MSGFRNDGPVLGIVPARGGSKGLPGKNTRLLAGLPLLVHTLRAASGSALSDCVVSTDDPAIAETARAHGGKVPFLRPAEFAGDEASVWPAVRLSATRWERESGRRLKAVALLQPTSPLRTAADIDGCLGRFDELDAEACVSVCVPHDNPYFNMVEADPDTKNFVRSLGGTPRQRRQECPAVYALNGAVYVIRREVLDRLESPLTLKRLAVYEMPRSRSVDVDTEDDMALAEFWLARAREGR